MRVGGDFTGQHDQTGVGQRLGGHAAARVLLENGVKDCVGNLVGNLVGVAFGDGFGSEEKVVRHVVGSSCHTVGGRCPSLTELWRTL